jgi:hypothetical protein
MKLKHLFIPLTGLALISLASPSYAVDYKVYPGAGCQPRTGGQAGSFTTDETGFTNTSTQLLSVACPLVRDRTPDPDFFLLDPGVRVKSSNGAILTCTFFSMDQNGGRVSSVFRSTREDGPIPLVFGGTIPTKAAGSYVFLCNLPPNGKVINYSLGENGETSGETSGN